METPSKRWRLCGDCDHCRPPRDAADVNPRTDVEAMEVNPRASSSADVEELPAVVEEPVADVDVMPVSPRDGVPEEDVRNAQTHESLDVRSQPVVAAFAPRAWRTFHCSLCLRTLTELCPFGEPRRSEGLDPNSTYDTFA